jgi:hypothetical protein
MNLSHCIIGDQAMAGLGQERRIDDVRCRGSFPRKQSFGPFERRRDIGAPALWIQ